MNIHIKYIFKVLFSSFLLCIHHNANAESHLVQLMEGEIKGGISLPIGNYHSGTSQVSFDMGIEGRYNFKGSPYDCGLMLDLSTARRGYNHLDDDNFDRWQNNRTLALALVGDYNFRQGFRTNPFIGTGIGIAFNDVVGDKYYPSKGTSFLFAPRIGVEFISIIRVSTQFNFSRKGYNNFCFNLGFVVGGRSKYKSNGNI